MREDSFLNIIHQTIPDSAKYLGDDTAYIPEKDLILTQDTLIEEVHFKMRTISPYYLGRKSLAVNLSDIAAAGGVPLCVMISLSMPKTIDDSFVKEFYKGVNSICKEFNIFVAGGDLTAADKIAISVCALGSGQGLTPANRRNASVGDIVAVTGNFGSSAAGFKILETFYKETSGNNIIPKEIREKFINAHIDPVPKLKEGRKILEKEVAPAIMDSSDGLGDALYKLCKLSSVSMNIDFEAIPYDKDILAVFDDKKTVINKVIFGGEDYELVAIMSEKVYELLKDEINLKKIGVVKEADKKPFACIRFKDNSNIKIDNEALNTGMFKHFD